MIAKRIIRHLSGLTVQQGHGYGQPFPVWPWQRRFLHGAFRPGVAEAVLSMGRGGGKTTLIAGIATACLEAQGVAQPRAEILIVASSMDQGSICFRHILRFLSDRKKFRIQDTINRMDITSMNGIRVRVLPASPQALHGAAPHLIIADEVAQWPRTKIDRMLAGLRTSGGKIPGSRMVLFGTRAATPEHPFEMAIAGADYAQVHSAGMNDPIGQKRTWAKANPSVRHNPVLETAYRREAKKAKQSPASMQSFKALRLNLGVADSLENWLLDADTWKRIEGEAEAKGPCYWGIDMGSGAAASAVACYWPTSGRLEAVAAFGQVPDLRERALADGAGSVYRVAHRRGEIVLLGERVPPAWQLISVCLRRWGRPRGIACDTWRKDDLRDALDAAGLSVPVDLRRQGFGDGAADVRAFRAAVGAVEKSEDVTLRVVPRPSVFLLSCMASARTVADPAGNVKLAKAGEGKRPGARDDAAAAAILAVSLAVRRHKPGAGGIRLVKVR